MDQKTDKMDYKMKMWKMRKEMLDSMNEKELRAFITGYMMAESKILRKLGSKCNGGYGCGSGSGCSCGCGSGCSCGCGAGSCTNGECECSSK